MFAFLDYSPLDMAATIPPQPGKRKRSANCNEENLAYSNHVRGYHVGAMTIEEFRLQYTTDVQVQEPTPKVDWSSVLDATVENDMYEPFVSSGASRCCHSRL